MEKQRPIVDLFEATHPIVPILAEAVKNGKCADALRHIADNPAQAPGDFTDILVQVHESLDQYPKQQQNEILAELVTAARNVAEHFEQLTNDDRTT